MSLLLCRSCNPVVKIRSVFTLHNFLDLEEAMMHIEILAINLRNILLFQLLTVLIFTGNLPVLHHGLLRIWKTLSARFITLTSAKTNNMSDKFWEIDMTRFEP